MWMVPTASRYNSLSNLLDEFFDTTPTKNHTRSSFPVDIEESENAYHLTAEMPGVKKEDINISVEDGVLKISTETKSEKKKESDGYRYCERHRGSFERTFKLQDDLDSAKISASYEDGLLKLEIPKKEKAKPKQIVIK